MSYRFSKITSRAIPAILDQTGLYKGAKWTNSNYNHYKNILKLL